jgi:AraC-like DNA-binding protein
LNNSYFIYPSAPLLSYVKYYWILKRDENEEALVQTIPSGCMHLVFHRGNNLQFSPDTSQPRCFVRGQLSAPGNILSQGGIDMIAIVFHPLGMTPFVHSPMSEFYNQYINLENLDDSELKKLSNLILNEEDVDCCIQHIEKYLLGRLTAVNYNYKRISGSIQLIKHQPQVKTEYLANEACLGYRHFKRVFTQYVGMNPKEYSRIIRFQKALYILQQVPNMEITQLAYTCGYYDHPHLIKDFQSFTGLSPSQYLSSHNPYSTFFSNDCRLNLIRQHG